MFVQIVSKDYEVKDISWTDDKGRVMTGKVAEQKAFLDTGEQHWQIFFMPLRKIRKDHGPDQFISYDEGIYEVKSEDNFFIDKYKKPAFNKYLNLMKVEEKQKQSVN